MALKFKVGDRVKLVGWNESIYLKESSYGKTDIIREVIPIEEYPYLLTDTKYRWRDEELELVNENKIVITTDGKTTLARLYDGSKVIKSAKAKCSPEDTFDFAVGAKLAYDRLMGISLGEEKKPTYKSGDKVKVIGNTCCHYMKVGDIITLRDNNVWGDSDKWHYVEHAGYIHERDIEPYTPVVVNGFKVGDRVNYKGHNGTIICIAKPEDDYDEQTIGIEFDANWNSFMHNCDVGILRDGKRGTKGTSWWINPNDDDDLKHGELRGYNGKFVCVRGDEDFKVGKVYEMVNGKFRDEAGDERPEPSNPNRRVESLDDFWLNSGYKFIPYVED